MAVYQTCYSVNGTFVLPQVLADGSQCGWNFTTGIPFKLHMEFLFSGFHGRNAGVVVYI
jgi:hypothetical protein